MRRDRGTTWLAVVLYSAVGYALLTTTPLLTNSRQQPPAAQHGPQQGRVIVQLPRPGRSSPDAHALPTRPKPVSGVDLKQAKAQKSPPQQPPESEHLQQLESKPTAEPPKQPSAQSELQPAAGSEDGVKGHDAAVAYVLAARQAAVTPPALAAYGIAALTAMDGMRKRQHDLTFRNGSLQVRQVSVHGPVSDFIALSWALHWMHTLLRRRMGVLLHRVVSASMSH